MPKKLIEIDSDEIKKLEGVVKYKLREDIENDFLEDSSIYHR